MAGDELKVRTKSFALAIVGLVEPLPRTRVADVMGRQLLRCGTSVGANCRAACRAKSRADFISKMGIVEEELDESVYWLELLIDSGIPQAEAVQYLLSEANQLTSIRTARRNGR